MRLLCFVLLASLPFVSFSQGRNSIYPDVAITPLAYGASVTLDKSMIRHLQLGLGAQLYDYPGYSDVKNDQPTNIRKAIFIDIRPYWKIKHDLIFAFCDLGYDFFPGERDRYFNNPDNAFYTGIGAGYGYIIGKRRITPYITLKFASDEYPVYARVYSPNGGYTQQSSFLLDANLVLSVGVKF